MDKIVGLTEDEAYVKMYDIAKRMGVKLSIRIESRDGVKYELTSDHESWRFNLSIINGIVANVRMG